MDEFRALVDELAPGDLQSLRVAVNALATDLLVSGAEKKRDILDSDYKGVIDNSQLPSSTAGEFQPIVDAAIDAELDDSTRRERRIREIVAEICLLHQEYTRLDVADPEKVVSNTFNLSDRGSDRGVGEGKSSSNQDIWQTREGTEQAKTSATS